MAWMIISKITAGLAIIFMVMAFCAGINNLFSGEYLNAGIDAAWLVIAWGMAVIFMHDGGEYEERQ
jgi:hypothetical protein